MYLRVSSIEDTVEDTTEDTLYRQKLFQVVPSRKNVMYAPELDFQSSETITENFYQEKEL